MKNILSYSLVMIAFAIVLISCNKDETKAILGTPSAITGFTSTTDDITLSADNDSTTVVTFKWSAPDYSISVPVGYLLQFTVPSDTSGATAWSHAKNVMIDADSLQKSFLGTDFNALAATQLGLPTDEISTIVVRVRSDVKTSGSPSNIPGVFATLTMKVTPYDAIIVYPALLVNGGNSWHTPTTRTNGYLLTSQNFDSKYEGYLNLPDADGWGGDAFTLTSSTTGITYGWGSDAYTMSVGGGNLWLTPAPNYMKVNADISALTISYTPVKFFISGDDNGWSTSATPMTFNPATNQWIATNVSLTAGKGIVFTSNGNYDISYKVDDAGKLVFAGAPNWPAANNIPVTQTGVFTVILDLSQGAGNYSYKIE